MYSLLTVKSSYRRLNLRSDGPYSSLLIMNKYTRLALQKYIYGRKNNCSGNTCYILPKVDKFHMKKKGMQHTR